MRRLSKIISRLPNIRVKRVNPLDRIRNKREILKYSLRYFILWSSGLRIFLSLYQLLYLVVIRLALLILLRCPHIEALYLSRGCAKDEIIPGISDIDLSGHFQVDWRVEQALAKAEYTEEGIAEFIREIMTNTMTISKKL